MMQEKVKRNMGKWLPSVLVINFICCSLLILIASAKGTEAAATTTTTAAVKEGGALNVVAADDLARKESSAATSKEKDDCTDLARDDETLMVFSTLGGGLTAIDPVTSEIRWTITDDPPIIAKQQDNNVQTPQYLPDPRDGSIYQLGDMGSLKKLPYTIPQLVANAPCRSSDGILYSGKKSDTWFIVDPKTGRREKVMGFGGPVETNVNNEKIGWATSRSIYLGRTQYTVMMYDSLSKDENAKPWNITFYDYNAVSMTPDISKEYEYIHLTTTSNGNILTLDRANGKFLWKRDLASPVVSAFLLGPDGLLSVPFTTVSDEAFNAILEESRKGNVNTVRLFQSLYVGEHNHGLYALPSLTDKNTPKISTAPSVRLIDGPQANSEELEGNVVYINDVIQNNAGIVLGHYNVPNEGNLEISPTPLKGPNNHDLATIHPFPGSSNSYTVLPLKKKINPHAADVGIQTEPVIEFQIESNNAFNKTKRLILANSSRIQKFFNEWFRDHPSGQVHQILIVIVLAMVTMFWYMCATMRELKNQSENGSKTYASSKGSNNSNVSTQDLVDLGDGNIRVGKISFNLNDVLGKGCEGTFVFRGSFEERYVAVKRLLPECFTFADREVALLRESDAHENVVRYFCTEQDRQFRYIAVELCAATLQDYTEGDRSHDLREQISAWEVLRQAVAGLSHLHSLNIVHRDIKPQNVLLSLPDAKGEVRVMISDFGLCKKLNYGKASFSRRSGVTGTEGWIAPEMMRGQRTTTSVDIFSLGCVFYYVLTDGHHAFGDALKRQANILSNEYNLSKLRKEDTEDQSSKSVLAEQLIADMIHTDPQRRPPSRSIGNHPLFWNDQRILQFLQDVSDRVEKLQFHVEPLKSLEKNGHYVVRDDWNLHLDDVITDDLRKYRGYMGASVRDLLRALRNKKHHYHELDTEIQSILGNIPHEFTNYWISKFPQLISHTYHAFTICSKEPAFRPYYNGDYQFTRPDYFDMDDALFPLVTDNPKPLMRQNNPNGSPKKTASPHNTQRRKGMYNFRKSAGEDILNNYAGANGNSNVNGGGAGAGAGFQRYNQLDQQQQLQERREFEDDDFAADVNNPPAQKRDVFANFKFRRYGKPANRVSNNSHNNYNNTKQFININTNRDYNIMRSSSNNNVNNNNNNNNRENNAVAAAPWILPSEQND